jgi:quinol monooxygenase YgiN
VRPQGTPSLQLCTLVDGSVIGPDNQREHSVQQPAGLDGILIPPLQLHVVVRDNKASDDIDLEYQLQIIMRLLCGAGGEAPANENREEQSDMTNETVIMLIEAKIQPQRRTALVEAARQYLPLVRAEPGVEAFYITARKDDPNTLVFYEIYRSQAAQNFHLQQDFTKKFLATLKSAQIGDRVRTNLVELDPEGQTHSN